MVGKFIRSIIGLSLLALPLMLLAQQDPSSMGQSGSSSMGGSNVTATGCLQKGSEPGGYHLTSDDGKSRELTGNKMNLADHVGHKITVTGQQMQRSQSQETKVESAEKAEAGGNQYGDLRVSNVKMVSTSCQ